MKLGDKVRDMITGFTGIAIGRTDWLYGCSRIAVEPTELKDGKPIEVQWFDEQRVEVVEAREKPMSASATAITGGPQSTPTRNADPVR